MNAIKVGHRMLVKSALLPCTWSLTVRQFARILIICLAACSLPSLGAFPTDKVSGLSQEKASLENAAAIDLLADLVAGRAAVAKPCEIRPCPKVHRLKITPHRPCVRSRIKLVSISSDSSSSHVSGMPKQDQAFELRTPIHSHDLRTGAVVLGP